MIYDADRNVVVYEGTEALRAAAVCLEGARRLSGNRVAYRATLPTLQRLAAGRVAVPEPMRDYDWPGPPGMVPFRAQLITANFLTVNPRAFVFNDMGTGKTAAALWAADWLMQQGVIRKALIVSTLSTLESVWMMHIFKLFLGRRRGVILHGSEARRLKRLEQDADFYIVNADGLGVGARNAAPGKRARALELSGFSQALADRQDIELAVVDEASVYREHTTRRHAVARRLLAPRPFLWLMTGTPVTNGPTDAYGMAHLVNNAWGESHHSFKNRTMVKVSNFKWVPARGSTEMVHKLLQPAVRYSISDCMDLPPCTVQQRDVDLSAVQKKAYDGLRKDAQLHLENGTRIDAVNEGALRTKLLQIVCGAVYDQNHEFHELDAAPRYKVLDEVLSETHEKVIVFAPFTSAVKLLNRRLITYSRAVINGETPAGQRQKIISDFQEKAEPRILIADPGTMAHGVTLTRAATIVWWAPCDGAEKYLQANKRIDRPGQRNHTTIVQLAGTKVEQEIYKRLDAGQSLLGAVLVMMEDK